MGRVQDKVAVITGGGSGLGRAMARLFAKEGAKVIAADIKGQDEAAAGWDGKIVPFTCNVTSPEQIQAMFAECKERFGRLDILCNNAGIGLAGVRIHEVSLENWDKVIEVNLRGAFMVLKYGLPLMMASGGGSVVNTASTSGFKAAALNGAYTPSKGAMVMLTRMAALEYAPDNIRVNAICPGPIETPIYNQVPPQKKAAIIDQLPLKRMGTAEEVANLGLFLASDESSFVTGACYVVDGGRLIA